MSVKIKTVDVIGYQTLISQKKALYISKKLLSQHFLNAINYYNIVSL